jgi:hypothetical protein
MRLPELLEVIRYNGEDVQITEVHDVSEANTMGEPEYMWVGLGRNENVYRITEKELANDRRKEASNV